MDEPSAESGEPLPRPAPQGARFQRRAANGSRRRGGASYVFMKLLRLQT